MCILLVGFLGLLWHHHCRKISNLKVCGLHIPEAHSLAFICCLSKVLISTVRSNLARWSFEWTVWVHHRWLTSGKVPNNEDTIRKVEKHQTSKWHQLDAVSMLTSVPQDEGLLARRRMTTHMTIFWAMKNILHPHQPCKHFKNWSLRTQVSECS